MCVSVCVCVCLSASISPESHERSLPNFCACCLSPWLSLNSFGGVTKSQGEEAIFGVFFPIDGIAFGTHTKTSEPIEMPICETGKL